MNDIDSAQRILALAEQQKVESMPGSLAYHDRLDAKLHVNAYTSAACGSPNAMTGRPEYCDYDCPTLRALHKS